MKKFVSLSLSLFLCGGHAFASAQASAASSGLDGPKVEISRSPMGMHISATFGEDKEARWPEFRVTSAGSHLTETGTNWLSTRPSDLIEAKKTGAINWLEYDKDWAGWLSLRLRATADGFLGGAIRTMEQMWGQYGGWLDRRLNDDWTHGLVGRNKDGEYMGWVVVGGYDPSTVKVRNDSGNFVNASDDDRYKAAFEGVPTRKELAGWLDPKYRDKGVVSWGLYALIFEILPKVDAGLTTEIILTIEPSNARGVRLLTKLGFAQDKGEFFRKTGNVAEEYSPRLVFRLYAKNIPSLLAAVSEQLAKKKAAALEK